MKIGVLGLGHMGLPISRFLHGRDHEVFTWSRTPHEYPWVHSTSLGTMRSQPLDALLIASGSARPGFGDHFSEINSTLNLIPESFRYLNTKILYLSSGAVYGECSKPMREIDPISPSTTYGRIKASIEEELRVTYTERFTAIRIGNVIDFENPYGILAISKMAEKTGLVNFYGDPNSCRDYIEINELSHIVSKIIELESREDTFNLGSGITISLIEFAQMLSSVLPSLKISWEMQKGSDLSRTQLDISRVRNFVGIEPTNPKEILKARLM